MENNQLSLQSSAPPPWLPGLVKLPGFTGQSASKDDSVIVDPSTELNPAIKGGPLVTTMHRIGRSWQSQ